LASFKQERVQILDIKATPHSGSIGELRVLNNAPTKHEGEVTADPAKFQRWVEEHNLEF
jgi:hypothetical protein